MERSVLFFVATALLLGCHSVPNDRATHGLDPERREGILARATAFFHPILPESDHSWPEEPKNEAKKEAKNDFGQPFAGMPYGPNAYGFHPYGPYGPTYRGSVNRPSQMLYNFDFVEEQESQESEQHFAENNDKREKRGNSGSTEPWLLSKKGDSEQLQKFLELVRSTPPERRGVDSVELKRLIVEFRGNMLDDADPLLEANYLVQLRRKILPDYKPTPGKRKIVDEFDEDDEVEDEDEELLADRYEIPTRKSKYSVKNSAKNQVKNASYSVKNSKKKPISKPQDDEMYWADNDYGDVDNAAPMPLPNRSNSQRQAQQPQPAVVAASYSAEMPSASTPPRPLPSAGPKYPQLVQMDGNPNASSIVHATYQTSRQNVQQYLQHVEPQNAPVGGGIYDDWETQARNAAATLRRKIEQTPDGRTFSNEARLRLLELVLGHRSEAVRPFSLVEKPLNEFWGNQMLGFSALMDDLASPEPRTRFVNAAFRFDEGLTELRRLCPMRLRNVQFVKDWASFGVFLPRNEEFGAGEEIGLYIELENPTIRHSAQGYSVKTTVTYEIRDSSANIIEKSQKIPVEEMTPSRKRDYCVYLRFPLPKSISHGQYQLRVSVTDMNSESLQYAEEQLPLKVLPTH